MPRRAREIYGGYCYHVINRGNNRATVFHDAADYQQFANLMAAASKRVLIRLVAWVLMPNHFHLVLWPRGDGDISLWMHWLLTTHARRHHRRYDTSGRIWQGRFKPFVIEQDDHCLSVMRYVERNPVRAHLVQRAEQWSWSSIGPERPDLPLESPVPRFPDWINWVNEPQTAEELVAIRRCANEQRPFGSKNWVKKVIAKG